MRKAHEEIGFRNFDAIVTQVKKVGIRDMDVLILASSITKARTRLPILTQMNQHISDVNPRKRYVVFLHFVKRQYFMQITEEELPTIQIWCHIIYDKRIITMFLNTDRSM